MKRTVLTFGLLVTMMSFVGFAYGFPLGFLCMDGGLDVAEIAAAHAWADANSNSVGWSESIQ